MADEEARAERQRLRAERAEVRVAAAYQKKQHDDAEADLAAHKEEDAEQ